MKVLLLCPDFPPVLNSAARLFGELAEDLAAAGHEVWVLTRIPERYLPRGIRLSLGFIRREKQKSIQVWRLRNLPVPRRMPLARALEHFWLALEFLSAGLLLPRCEAVIVYSPPLPLALAGYLLSKIWRGRVIVNVQDLYPRTAMDLGLLKNRVLIRLAELLEGFIYRRTDVITVHSQGNRDHVLRRGGRPDRVLVVPNWVDLREVSPGPRENGWRERHGLGGRFVVSYAGTMGFGQGLEEVVLVAERLKTYREIRFVLAGDGVFAEDLRRMAEVRHLDNVVFLPPQPPEDYLELLRASDVCLVTLHRDLRTPVVPGKLPVIMAAGRPVICYASPASDARAILEEARCGLFVPAGDATGLTEAIIKLYNDRDLVELMGQNARVYAEKHFDRRQCTNMYIHLLEDLLERRRTK